MLNRTGRWVPDLQNGDHLRDHTKRNARSTVVKAKSFLLEDLKEKGRNQ